RACSAEYTQLRYRLYFSREDIGPRRLSIGLPKNPPPRSMAPRRVIGAWNALSAMASQYFTQRMSSLTGGVPIHNNSLVFLYLTRRIRYYLIRIEVPTE